VYARFWMSLLRWMLSGSDFLPGAEVALRSARRSYTDEQTMQFLILTRGLDTGSYRPRLAVRGANQAADLEPRQGRGGVYTAEAGPFPPGTYQVVLRNNIGSPTELATTVDVLSASVEHRVLSADPEAMARLAAISDGESVAPDEVGDLPGIVRRWRAARQIATRRAALWDRWWILIGILAALGLEWFLRRREGLL
jgi:hypothetical protein